MLRMSACYSFIICIAGALAAVACSERKPELSQEQVEHQKSINYCVSVLVEAGAKWHQGDQVGKLCERRNPTRPELARREIMDLLGKKGLAAENVSYPFSLPNGNCKVLAEHFINLHEKAYAQNDGEAKAKMLSEANEILTTVNAGSCALKTSPTALK